MSKKPKGLEGLRSFEEGYKVRYPIYLRQLRYYEAEEKLIKEIDQAFVKGYSQVEVIHGLSGGTLRKLTRTVAEAHPLVESIMPFQSRLHHNPGSTILILHSRY